MIMLVSFAFVSAPFAYLRTELANLFGVRALSRHRFDAQFTHVNAFDAAPWAFVGTFLSCHRVETFDAFNDARLARFDTLRKVIHPAFLFFAIRKIRFTGRMLYDEVQPMCHSCRGIREMTPILNTFRVQEYEDRSWLAELLG